MTEFQEEVLRAALRNLFQEARKTGFKEDEMIEKILKEVDDIILPF